MDLHALNGSAQTISRLRGFTLVELIIVMVLIGILAIAAIPRFWDRQLFDSRGFYDQTLSALRYAQKTAIAQRRNVCAEFAPNKVTLRIGDAFGAACNTPLDGPTGGQFVVTAKPGVTFRTPPAQPANFQFNALGQASVGQTIQVTGSPLSIIIERETGYVHP